METKPHLYIISFKDSNYFKEGHTSKPNFNRILQHNNTYLLDEEIIIYEGDNVYLIRLLEEAIKREFPQDYIDEEYLGMDGYTEIRNKEIYNDVIEFIDKTFPHFGLERKKINLKDIITENTKSNKVFRDVEDDIISNGDIIEEMINTLNQLDKVITNIKDNETHYEISFNLSKICYTDDDVNEILNPFLYNIIKDGKIYSVCDGYKYNVDYSEVIINLGKEIDIEYIVNKYKPIGIK